jgi:predicted Zn-dependent protease
MSGAAQLLSSARAEQESENVVRQLAQSQELQENVIDSLEDVLRNLVDAADIQRAISQLNQLLKKQTQLHHETIKESEEQLEDIFE